MNKTQLQKTKEKTKLQKRKLIRRQNESDREIKENERRQKKEVLVEEDIDLCRFFELATSNK